MSQSMISQLALLISSSVETLEKVCLENQWNLPDLNAPGFYPQTEGFRSNAVAAEAAKIAASACMQLIASLVPPTDSLYRLAAGERQSAAVRVCLEANVTEILREAGPNGLHVDQIAAKCGLDSSKLGRILRFLATHHVYRELKPYVFTNNRVSGTMDTGKPSKDIFNESVFSFSAHNGLLPDERYFAALTVNTIPPGFLLSSATNHKCSAVAWDVLKDPIHGHSDELTDTVFSRGLNTNLTFWQFFEHPDNYFRHRRFGFVMQGMAAIQPADMIFKAFDWDALPKDSLVVDVGGGIGVAAMPLARKYPDLNIIVQDLPKVVDEGKKAQKFPDALKSGRIKIEFQDFFTPQSITNPAVFLVKQVLHNWPKQYMSKILQQLRAAATKETVLVIIDNVLPYACRGNTESEFVEKKVKEAPEPLLPNYGSVGNAAYSLDISASRLWSLIFWYRN
ncbi:hypothetical protein GALMADRAFT_147537 [Galerina marginata CBS 339.88]|uniref:Uncharacterized protein n=1 Tax=Galerina marginata (strain CBS 339.88) TaxID=685588 RepID=A0A067SAD3_GALM3|nr:hypothetical protein GALMADRAFT_147537 [Galerina marginata CBS 339.88]